LDKNDKSNKADLDKIEEVLNFQRVVKRTEEKGEHDTAVKYLDNILAECPGSLRHALQKIQNLLDDYKLKEALEYSKYLLGNKLFKDEPEVIEWGAKILIYSSKEA
jgi:hypothetical protein